VADLRRPRGNRLPPPPDDGPAPNLFVPVAPATPSGFAEPPGSAPPGSAPTSRRARSAQRREQAPSGRSGAGRRVSPGAQLTGARRVVHLVGLPTAALMLLGWSMTTLIGDVRWGPLSVLPVGLASISPLVALTAVPLVTMAIRARRRLPVIPAVVAGLLPWVFVLGYASPAPEPTGATLPLRAMIVTARDGSADAADIAAAVRDQKIDLLVVTELSAALAHDLTVAGVTNRLTARWVEVPQPGDSPAAGMVVYSRFPIDGFTRLPGTHWPAVAATVTVDTTRFTLIAGHAVQPSMDHLDLWRRDLAAFGAAARVKGPVVVLANLNATPWHPQFRRLVEGRLHDAGDVLGRGLRPTWPSWGLPLLPTDHALVAGGVGVEALDTTGIQGSDHRALTVSLRIPVR
jgi:endonuclease/exonuclease/phosphatase (EEP) superfamily protein YafD